VAVSDGVTLSGREVGAWSRSAIAEVLADRKQRLADVLSGAVPPVIVNVDGASQHDQDDGEDSPGRAGRAPKVADRSAAPYQEEPRRTQILSTIPRRDVSARDVSARDVSPRTSSQELHTLGLDGSALQGWFEQLRAWLRRLVSRQD
jgi:hypothetical protein